MSTLINDIKYAFRQLRKSPGFTIVAVLSLALGIGANTTLFSVIYNVLLRPLSFPEPQNLVQVKTHWIDDDSEGSISGPDYVDWAAQNSVFASLTALQFGRRFSLTGSQNPIALKGAGVSTNCFDTLFKGQMHLGRGFVPEDAQMGNHHVAVISYQLWQDLFAADQDVIGREINIDREPWTVVGVAKQIPGFLEKSVQIFVPLVHERMKNRNRDSHYLSSFGRLKDGITLAQAQAEMGVIGANLAKQYPRANERKRILVFPLHKILVRDVRTAMLVMYGAVGFVLLIACVNVSSMMLAKATTRTKEMALRSALGASRQRIVRQVLTESLILSLLGGALGLLMGYWGLNALKFISPYTQGNQIPGYDRIGLNTAVLGFTGIISVLTAIGFGLVPAFTSSSLKLNQILRAGAHQMSAGIGHHRPLNALVVTQVAMALMLLTGASLLVRSFQKLNHTNPGFDLSNVLAVKLELPHTDQNKKVRNRAALFNRIVDRLEALPSVEAAGGINMHPLLPYNADTGCRIDGRRVGGAEYRMITTDYFKSMKIPLMNGRYFLATDNLTDKRVAIVNQEFVRRYCEGINPVGRKISYDGTEKIIVGVVGNVKRDSMRAVDYEPFMYQPIHQDSWHQITFFLRTTGDPMALVDSARRTIWDIDPDQPVLSIEPMRQIFDDSISVERFCTILLSVMASVALLIAVVGIYGTMAFAVNERTNEIGIRLAIGAQKSDILLMVAQKGLVLTAIGLTAGLVGALVLTQYMSSMLYEISTTDPATFILMPFILFGIALLACVIPARRAAKVDPMEALRYE